MKNCKNTGYFHLCVNRITMGIAYHPGIKINCCMCFYKTFNISTHYTNLKKIYIYSFTLVPNKTTDLLKKSVSPYAKQISNLHNLHIIFPGGGASGALVDFVSQARILAQVCPRFYKFMILNSNVLSQWRIQGRHSVIHNTYAP